MNKIIAGHVALFLVICSWVVLCFFLGKTEEGWAFVFIALIWLLISVVSIWQPYSVSDDDEV